MSKRFIFDIETTGLEPCKDRILCISLLDLEKPEELISLYGEDEKKILTDFWEKSKDAGTLIGFNSEKFDFQFIFTRSFLLGIKLNPHTFPMQLDLRNIIFPFNKYSKGKLDEIAKAISIDVKTENGMFMPGYYLAKNWDKIKEHCEEDVIITHKIYERCTELGMIPRETFNNQKEVN